MSTGEPHSRGEKRDELLPVEAMTEDQLVESLREAFEFLEGVPAIGAEVVERVVDSLSEIIPAVSEAMSELMQEGDPAVDEGAGGEG